MSENKRPPGGVFEEIGTKKVQVSGFSAMLKEAVRKTSDFLQRSDVSRVRDVSEGVLEILADVDPKSPISVAAASAHLVSLAADHLVEVSPWSPLQRIWSEDIYKPPTARRWMEMNLAYHFFPYLPKERIQVHFDPGMKKKAKDAKGSAPEAYERIYCADLGSGMTAYWTATTMLLNDPKEQILAIPMVHGVAPGGSLLPSYGLIRDAIWTQYDNHIEFWWDAKKEDIQFKIRQDPPWGYKGDRGLQLIDQWRKFIEAGKRRAVILHGLPGNGKSTLAREAAKRLGKRTLYMPLQTLENIPLNLLSQSIAILSPQVLIVDDLDRLGSLRLEKLLFLFEDQGTEMASVPMIIATTNSIERLPQALRRPGRFDEVWQIDPPDEDMLKDLVTYLSQEEGLILGEEDHQAVVNFCNDRGLSGAHIREIIRRVQVLGMSALIIDSTDLTFSSEFFCEDDYDAEDDEYEGDADEDDDDEYVDEDDEDEEYEDEDGNALYMVEERGSKIRVVKAVPRYANPKNRR